MSPFERRFISAPLPSGLFLSLDSEVNHREVTMVCQQDDPTRIWISACGLDLGTGNVQHQLHGSAKLSFDNFSQWCNGELLDLLTTKSAKVRAK